MSSGATMVDKVKRLDAANQERAEAAVLWEAAENKADETAAPADQSAALERDRALVAADRKIKRIESEP
jgi:hypothetical protein